MCSFLFTAVLPVDLGWIRPERSQHERTGREDRRLNFYNERDNLTGSRRADSNRGPLHYE